MKNLLITLSVILLLASCASPSEESFATKTATEDGYTYEYVENDPMKTRIYTLANGLKVYLSDYKNEPRLQVYIPVKAGGKNDPATNTGLAHYLEHMMFKGNDKFGTLNYEEEKPKLDSIESMFNFYATLTDSIERKNYYAKIDAYSNEAAELAIPNEYDKMMSLIGGKGLNAYTTEDRTVYTVDIPTNEMPRFMEIEGSRFKKIVNRLFHTELEAVYEEKNRSLDSDRRKVFEALFQGIFSKHQYGTQTVIGTIDHLKNPSITEIKNYFNTYYRPNNVAICISGDIDYTNTIKLIEENFGDWETNNELPKWTVTKEDPITAPIEIDIYGPDAEYMYMAYRMDGFGSDDYLKARMLDMILNNSKAGLIDINLKQKQTVLSAGSFAYGLNDYAMHVLYGNAKQNQSLKEVQGLLMEQVNKLKSGDFEDWLIKAVIADFKKSEMSQMESNRARANKMVMAFTNDMPWSDYLQEIEKMEKITKEELVQFANEKYGENYVVVYKHNGEDVNKQQVEKPQITKVPLNRENKSAFHQAIANKEIAKLKPVFIDYAKDIAKLTVNNVEVLAKQNDENELFELTYLLDIGKNADPKLGMAVEYLEFIGTEELSAEEFQKELYKLGCSFSVFSATERTYVTLSGLSENMEAATTLFESLLANPKADQEALDKLVDRTLKGRADAKKEKGTILWSGLYNYAQYGAENPFTSVLKNYQLKELKGEQLTDIIKGITKLPHRILYYGPRSTDELSKFLTDYHPVPATFDEIPTLKTYEELPIDESKVYWADYDMVQTEVIFLAKSVKFDKEMAPAVRMFNQYFGGGMNSIVFQEIREAQGLAYSVFSSYSQASKSDESDYLFAYIGTQVDKQEEAMDAMMNLINNMPESQEAFNIAKEAILNKIESERITKSSVIWNYINAQDKKLDSDVRQNVYDEVKNMTFNDMKKFQQDFIKDKEYITVLIGDKDKLDFKALSKYGEPKQLSLEELFGYEDSEVIELQ